MNIRMIFFFSLYFITSFISGMQQQSSANPLEFRKAIEKDRPNLLKLINAHDVDDRNKIVILPEKFREGDLRAEIENQHIFVAEHQKSIVGFKKLFILPDNSKKTEKLTDEIRCIDKNGNNNNDNCSFTGIINDNNTLVESTKALPADCYRVCIYNGADFTVPAYRGKGINPKLTTEALLSLINETRQAIQATNAKAITMVYGLAQANAGEQPGTRFDRTRGISKSFKDFIQALEGHTKPVELLHRRYHAYMPTFDPKSEVCTPLPAEQSIPGYGCVLTYELGK